jgi:hypothetical protein
MNAVLLFTFFETQEDSFQRSNTTVSRKTLLFGGRWVNKCLYSVLCHGVYDTQERLELNVLNYAG